MDKLPELIEITYQDIRQQIRSGDILLCSGSALFSNLIQAATHSVWSHVAFVIRVDAIDRIMVLESVESIGVRTVPLSNYVYDYSGTNKPYPGKLCIARHNKIVLENIKNLSRFAVDLLGYPYGNEEIARIAARISMNKMNLPLLPTHTPEREFICSEYADVCFKSIGITIKTNNEGFITPSDFANDSNVQLLNYITIS